MLSSKTIDDATAAFWDRYNRLMDLVKKARGIEIQIRIITQLSKTKEHFESKGYHEFLASNYKHETRSYDKLLNDFLPKHKDQFQKIRLIADAVAHADLVKAHAKINKYIQTYSINSKLDEKEIGLVLMNNTVDDEGRPCSVAYSQLSSANNLLTEEMEIFERQGYFAAAEEIFDYAIDTISKEANDIAIVDLLMKSQRAIKFGKKKYK